MGIFYESVKKDQKNRSSTFLLFLLLIVFGLIGGGYSMFQKFQNFQKIENQKSKTISEIEEKYNNESKTKQKYNELIKISNEPIENIKVEKKESSDEIISGLLGELNQSKTISENLSEEFIKSEKEKKQDLNDRENIMFKGDFCILGSYDEDKKKFFNSFSYENGYLVKKYTDKMNMKEEEFDMYCFEGVELHKNPYQKFRKMKMKKDSIGESYKMLLGYLGKKSKQYYKISFTKEQGNLGQYNGCLMKGEKGLDFIKYAKISIYGTTIQDLIQKGIIKNNCNVKEIKNIFHTQKKIPFLDYYNNLFKSKKIFNENKGTNKFKQWYENSSYEDGIDKFLNYLNYGNFSFYKEYINDVEYTDDVYIKDRDYYYNKKLTNLFHSFISDISTGLFNKYGYEQYLNH